MPRKRRRAQEDDDLGSALVVAGAALLAGYLIGKALSGGPSRTVRCSNCGNHFATRVPHNKSYVQTVCPYCSQSTIATVTR